MEIFKLQNFDNSSWWYTLTSYGSVLTKTQDVPKVAGGKVLSTCFAFSGLNGYPLSIYHSFIHEDIPITFSDARFGEQGWIVQTFGSNTLHMLQSHEYLANMIRQVGTSPVKRLLELSRTWSHLDKPAQVFPPSGYGMHRLGVRFEIKFTRSEKIFLPEQQATLSLVGASPIIWQIDVSGNSAIRMLNNAATIISSRV